MNTLTNERLEDIASSAVSYERISMANELLSLRAQLAELRGQEPVVRVSEESFSSDGTSDILTINLPIGMELFSRPVPPAAINLASAGWQACRDGHWFSIKAEDVPHYRDNEEVSVREVYAISTPSAASQPVLDDVIKKFTEMNIGFPVQKLKADYVISWVLNNYPCDIKSQPYMVPDELSGSLESIANKYQVEISQSQWIIVGWNACRAAMLQHHSGDVNDKVNSPVIPDGSALVLIEPTYPYGLASLITEGMNEMVGRTIGGYSSDNGD